ncbi:MAG: response regulator [Oscillospiraceae bacterium]|jgi:PAS domain S-box-containing protein|nr:response regulator [Oscillospiraceae bacterium]
MVHIPDLLRSEKYLRLLLKNSGNSILFMDRDGYIEYCSDTFLKLVGLCGYETIKRLHFAEMYRLFEGDAFIEAARRRFDAAKNEKLPIKTFVSIHFPGAGERRMYTIRTTPMIDEHGEFEGAQTLYIDVTDLVNAELSERTRAMLDATPLACSLWDAGGNLLDCNKEALRMFGLSGKLQYAERLYDLSPELQPDGTPSRAGMAARDQAAIDTGYQQFEWMHQTLSCEPLPVETTLVSIPWQDSYILATYSRDLREVKAAEKAKSDFLSRMSHEMRTPLNAIVGMAEIARLSAADDRSAASFDTVNEASHHLLGIINDILDMVKIDAGDFALSAQPFKLRAAMDDVISAASSLAAQKRQRFSAEVSDELPAFVIADERRFKQLLGNLLSNAAKFTPEAGEIGLCVKTLGGTDKKCTLCLEVSDTGVGISEEMQRRLWIAFEQSDNSITRAHGGTGLGLPIAKRIAELMGGGISVESELGRGSRFTCLVQVERDSARDAPGADVTLSSRRVLVVDDVEINREIAAALLEDTGASLDSAQNGEEAVALFAKNGYNIVLMDLHMPVMDGFEASRRIRASDSPAASEAVIIALTADTGADVRARCLSAGMNDHLGKPVERDTLLAVIAKHLGR